MEKGKKEVWSGKNHKKANNPLRDGDDEDTEKYPYYKDCYFIQAKSTVKPSVMDLQRHHLEGSEEVYSGMYIYLSMA
ncbi:ssDNA-binding protein, partial [Escherichia coli]|uniref:ssDNA-binding protein n=1 Tax=Escherichia coli TaxID=562 RepID=UPI003CE44F0A